jgi:hypothetical protein
METSEPKPTHCPECRSPRTAPISYGLVEDWDEALERDLAEGKYVLGGDIIFPDAARWACLDCDHRWGSFWSGIAPAALAGLLGTKGKSDAPCDQVPPRARIALQELGLSSSSLNCLESEGITTALDLCVRTADELLEIRNFGQEQLQVVRERLAAVDLWLWDEQP